MRRRAVDDRSVYRVLKIAAVSTCCVVARLGGERGGMRSATGYRAYGLIRLYKAMQPFRRSRGQAMRAQTPAVRAACGSGCSTRAGSVGVLRSGRGEDEASTRRAHEPVRAAFCNKSVALDDATG